MVSQPTRDGVPLVRVSVREDHGVDEELVGDGTGEMLRDVFPGERIWSFPVVSVRFPRPPSIARVEDVGVGRSRFAR